MLTASIYRDNSGTTELQQARDGLELLGGHVGGISVQGNKRINLNQGVEDSVALDRIGFANFDPEIDLHIVLTDRNVFLQNGQKVAGVAPYLSGVCVVDVKSTYGAVSSAVAHEAAHATGFVAYGAKNQHGTDEGGKMHCSCDECLMFPVFTVGLNKQTDFCGDCSDEMGLFGELNKSFIRYTRVRNRNKISSSSYFSDLNALVRLYEQIRT